MAVGCKIIRDFPRPARELVERFRGVATSNLVDVMGSCAAIDGALAPIGRGKLLGTAFPVRLPQGDNLMLHAAIDLAQPGDVLVIDAGGFSERAVLGELMASYCKTRGIRGIVCDGAIRDRGALAQMEDFPVYARSVTPNRRKQDLAKLAVRSSWAEGRCGPAISSPQTKTAWSWFRWNARTQLRTQRMLCRKRRKKSCIVSCRTACLTVRG